LTHLAPAARVNFADVQRHLALFAQGLAGQYLNLRVAEEAPPPPPAAGEIRIPAAIEDFATAEHNLGAFRIALLHQIGYLTQGSLTLEVGLAAFTPLLGRVFIVIEDLRIDTWLARCYPGAQADLKRVLAHALLQRPDIAALPAPLKLIEALRRYSLGESPAILILQDESSLLEHILDAAAAVEAPGADAMSSLHAARTVCDLITRFWGDVDLGEETGRTALAGDAKDSSLASDAVAFRGDLLMRLMQGAMGGGRSGDRQVESRLALGGTAGAHAAQGRGVTGTRAGRLVADGIADATRSYCYDEWDFYAQAYVRNWCRVHESRLRSDEIGFVDEVKRRHAKLLQQVHQQFARIKPDAWQRVHRASDGDELDLSAVIDAMVERRAGYAADSRLYTRRDRARRDVAAAFLADMSASTDILLPHTDSEAAPQPAEARQHGLYLYAGHDDPPPAPDGPKRRVIDVEKDALALMCDALLRLGDLFAVYGFSGDGRNQVEFHIAKDFGDRVTPRTWAALSAMQPRRSTRMGAAIRHAAWKLKRQSAAVKILIIVSDGYPEDCDYGPDRNDREYGIQDTARALVELQRDGMAYFCVTIDPSGHDYLKRMCAPSRYLVIDDVASLPRELTKIYRALTA
jgi:hypothetical protein